MVNMNTIPHTYKTSYLRATCKKIEHRTILAERYHDSPMKITKTFHEPSTNGLMLYLMDVSPGLMEGDHYEAAISLEQHTHLMMTNQSSTKIHPAKQLGAKTNFTFHIGEHAILEYMPEPTIPYRDSQLHAHNIFHLEEDSSLLYCDILSSGRVHHNEKFQYRQLSMTTEIFRSNKRVAYDHFLMRSHDHAYEASGALEHYTHQGAFWIFAIGANYELLSQIREICSSYHNHDIITGASLAISDGIIVRMAGHNVWQLQDLCSRIWQCARLHLLQFPPCVIRK